MSASLGFNFFVAKNTVSPEMGRIGNDAVKMAAKTSVASSLLGNRMVLMGGAIALAGSEAVALVDALAPLAGLLAAVPAVAAAGAVSVGALAIGFHGLGAAMKTSAGGAGPSASAIASAERRVASAQRESVQAQLDINDAREQAARNLQDIATQLERANLDQVDSTLSVREAELELARARRSHDRDAIKRAEIGLQRAQISARESVSRLAETQDEYNRKQAAGVEGSDEVVSAVQKQADATERLRDAQESLAQTKSGGGGADAAAAAYAKLAPSAKQVVDAFKALAPAATAVRVATQQALFAGLGQSIRALGATYLPMLRVQLAGVAKGWNIAFSETARLAQTPGFVKDTNTGLANTAKFSQLAGKAMAPVVSGLRHFAVIGSQYLPRLGGFIRDIGVGFERWARSARDTGKINKWIEDGTRTAQTFWRILLNVGGAVKGVFKAGSGGPAFLGNLEEITGKFRTWVDSASGQTKLHDFFTTLRDLAKQVGTIVGDIATILVNSAPALGVFGGYLSLAGWAVKFLAAHADALNKVMGPALSIYLGYIFVFKPLVGIVYGLALAFDIAKGAWIAFRLAVLYLGPWAPVILILTGIVLILKGLYDHVKGFRDAWDAAWAWVVRTGKAAVILLKKFVIDPIVKVILDPVGAIKRVWNGLWTAVGDGLKWVWDHTIGPIIAAIGRAIDETRRAMEGITGEHTITRPGQSGTGIGAALPHLASGGHVAASGLAVIHRGEDVVPARVVARGGGAQEVVVRIVLDGPDAVKRLIRKIVHEDGHGNVQTAFGR